MTLPQHLLLWIVSALLAGCRGVPLQLADGGIVDGALEQNGSAHLVLGTPRTFGVEGEHPTQLLSQDPDHLFALTNHAIILLDLDGRVIHREALPVTADHVRAVVTSAHVDEGGLGVAIAWGGDMQAPAGAYLALTDELGQFTPGEMIGLAPPGSILRGDWDGRSHQLVWLEPGDSGVDLRWAAVSRGGSVLRRLLTAGLSPGETSGDWLVEGPSHFSYCAVNEAGRTILRRFSATGATVEFDLVPADERALGRCRLASSRRSLMATWVRQSTSLYETDAGPVAPDLGLGAISFNVPVMQLLDPSGALLDFPQRLSLVEGTVRLESLVWDGHRYIALLNAAGLRGGRLLLTAFDEAGRLLFRDLLIPLDYDPGLLEAGRLLVTPGAYYLLYSTRRPWDEGICRLVRFELSS